MSTLFGRIQDGVKPFASQEEQKQYGAKRYLEYDKEQD